MKALNADIEVRFAVVTPATLTQYGTPINYYEINKVAGRSDEQDVDDAADEFTTKPEDILRRAFRDDFEIEGRRSWRGLFKRKRINLLPAPGSEEEYGIVINPPYPR